MTDVLCLDTLPCDVLFKIFDYCHAFDLVRLSKVCRRFYDIVNKNILWIRRSKQPLVTNQVSERFLKRCNPLLSLRVKWHVSRNWQLGRYECKSILSRTIKVMPWLQMTSNMLWWSGGNQLYGFRRTERNTRYDRVFNENNTGMDICKFVFWKDLIVTGHRYGNIKFWTKTTRENTHFLFSINAGYCDINALDATSNNIISGSENGTIKIWSMPRETASNSCSASILIYPIIRSLVADPTEVKFAVGSSGHIDPFKAVRIFDIECCRESDILQHKWRRGAGTLDMVWDNPHTLLTCGYDTYVRKWDLRTGTCVNAWEDPTNATLYCVSSDYHNTIIAGAQFNSKAVLWDQRKPDFVQLYFMRAARLSSPVYSLRFDSSHLYCATDKYIFESTFSGNCYEEQNYKQIITYDKFNEITIH